MIYIGADHRGFKLKEYLKKRLEEEQIEFVDKGNTQLDSQDDYVDFAQAVGDEVAKNVDSRGILVCGSGAGVDMVANKIDGIRSALVQDGARAKQAREHEDANVLALPADILGEEEAYQIVTVFLQTAFSNEERHKRRLEKMHEIEEA